MKIKDIEGTPEEIGKLCSEHDFSLNDYLHDKSNFKKWVVPTLSVVFFVICSILWTVQIPEVLQRILFLFSLLLLGWLIAILQLKYGNTYVSFFATLFGLIMLSVSLNILTPKDAIKTLREKLDTQGTSAK
jgi:energy-coupling factor transporter transmembrane protein EcfT